MPPIGRTPSRLRRALLLAMAISIAPFTISTTLAGGAPLALALPPPAMAHAAGQPVVAGTPGRFISLAYWQRIMHAPGVFMLPPKALYGAPSGLGNMPAIYIFADPNCIICHEFYNEVYPLMEANKVMVFVIPIGMIKPTSAGKAAHILLPMAKGKDAAAMMRSAYLLAQDEAAYDTKTREGGLSPSRNATALRMVDAHNRLLVHLTNRYSGFPRGRIEVPTIVTIVQGKPAVFFGAPPVGAAKFIAELKK
ncbi:hypothetical protein [Acidithiobacillus ferriphilus]|uniref:hypothetical protein n=1 Tax=Acidithiobacillus ferriphilus TaxID=1689834 RepID=UPI002DB797C7|nr:hypothetical protein [Acidithiobacillus ferriphilus]MEB8535131.1 hypothetical protein [Acidithiobacillus ferriphilus]